MTTSQATNKKPHVVIVGAGFGGLRAARALAGAPLQVTIIDRNNYHLFQPLLYQVATAGLSPDEIAHPVRAILRRQTNARFRMAEVTQVDLAEKTLLTTGGKISYDYLILAVGATTNFFGLESVAKNSFTLKDIDEATAIRNHVLRQFERASQEEDAVRRRTRLTFVVAGGGPTGVECAGALAELVHMVQIKDYAGADGFADARIILLEAADRLLSHMDESLSQATLDVLQRKGVEVRFGAAVKDFDGEQVTLQSGEILPALTLIWAAGARAAPLADHLGVAQGSQGRIQIEPTLQIAGHPEVFVIGDAACLQDESGKPLPMIAPVAIQQAGVAARNIREHLSGRPLQPFSYQDPGLLATIGRNQAVAQIKGLKLTGFPAWLVWLVVHIFQLIGFRNRLVVLINWAWDYLFYDRAVRLIAAE